MLSLVEIYIGMGDPAGNCEIKVTYIIHFTSSLTHRRSGTPHCYSRYRNHTPSSLPISMEKLHHLRIELQLLKDQVQDVTRGDLEDHVLVQSVVIMMVHLKNVINTIVDKSGQFAKEVTQVSQVGIEG